MKILTTANNRSKLYHRSKPYKSKITGSFNASKDLEIAASVNRPTILHKYVSKIESTSLSTDIEAQESNHKVTRLNFLNRRAKPSENIQESDQEASPSINRNNIQRRVSKPNQGNLLDGENSEQESSSTTNRMKIRRRISKPDRVNSATEDPKSDDHEFASSNRFKIKTKYNNSSVGAKKPTDKKDNDGYKVP